MAHHREWHPSLLRLHPVGTPELFPLRSPERLYPSIFPSPTSPIFSVRSQDCLRLAEFVRGIPPVERAQWFVDRVVRCFCFRLQAQCKLMNEPRVGATIPGRINGLLAPLQKPLRVGECPFLFGMTGGWEKENFCL